MNQSRRECLKNLTTLAALPLLSFGSFQNHSSMVSTRKIPSTGELLPIVGLGTWQTFDVYDNRTERATLSEVLKTLIIYGGSVVDSSPMYGSSEAVAGDLSAQLNVNDKLFMATKVWTTGKENGIKQMDTSLRLLKRSKLDLMQIHNLVDWQTHLRTLKQWKEMGKVRYIGITHYANNAHDLVERVMRSDKLDFVQINYSLLNRAAESKIFPLAQEKNIALLINRPFEEGALFQRVQGKALPEWAKEFDCESWGQFFLKFILAHPAVNCVIPGTSKPTHMLDNLKAGMGKLPDEQQRKKMIDYLG